MTDSLDALYARHGLEPGEPVDPESEAVQSLLAKHLDSGIFRRELLWLADEVGRLRAGPEEERKAARAFEIQARTWIAKLEADVEALQSELRREVARREALERETLAWKVRRRISPWVPEWVKRALGKGRDARD